MPVLPPARDDALLLAQDLVLAALTAVACRHPRTAMVLGAATGFALTRLALAGAAWRADADRRGAATA